MCLSGNKSQVNRNALTVWPAYHVTYRAVYTSWITPMLCVALKSHFILKQNFHLLRWEHFYVTYSIVLSPLGVAAPPPCPLAISFDNPSLCFCGEKPHSSRGMTSSVSTGAGTEDTTLPGDWVAPTGCCEQNPLRRSYVHRASRPLRSETDRSLSSAQPTHTTQSVKAAGHHSFV